SRPCSRLAESRWVTIPPDPSVTGSAGGSTAQNANARLEHCGQKAGMVTGRVFRLFLFAVRTLESTIEGSDSNFCNERIEAHVQELISIGVGRILGAPFWLLQV